MSNLVLKDIDDQLQKKLEQIAQRRGQTLEQTVVEILVHATEQDDIPRLGFGTHVNQLFKDCGLEEPIQEMRGFSPRPAEFSE